MYRFSFYLWSCSLVLLLLGACGGKKAIVDKSEKPNRDVLLAKIKKQEDILFKSIDNFDAEAANATRLAYMNYVDAFPKDTVKSPSYLFKAAEISRALKEHQQSIDLMERMAVAYPHHDKVPHARFLIGFIYETDLKDYEKAKQHYDIFIEKYPKHPLADDVEFSLQHIGLTPEEIIKLYEEEKVGE